MNKRRREILSALQPATDLALIQSGYRPDNPPKARDVPGLSMTARPSADAAAELMLYGQIGGGFWSDGITSSDVAAVLKQIGPGPINVRINSPGGDVFQGVAIHTLLARHPGVVTTYVDGLAASAASFVMLAGDRIVGSRGSFVMLHDAMTSPYGNAKTLRTSADLLDKVSDSMAEMYADQAGEDAAFWRDVMTVNGEDGTWYTGQEALEAGLVDEITGAADDDDSTDALLAGWVDVLPATISAKIKLPPEPEAEPDPAFAWDPAAFLTTMKGALL